MDLTPEQAAARAGFRGHVLDHVAADADRWDREKVLPEDAIRRLADAGYMAAMLPPEHGGKALDAVSHGLLHQELGRGCSSLRSVLTVHDMVAQAILRCGSPEQRAAAVGMRVNEPTTVPRSAPSHCTRTAPLMRRTAVRTTRRRKEP